MTKLLLKTTVVIKRIFLAVLFLLITVISYAQPANDNYANAIDVSSIINSCSADAFYTTVNATPDLNAGSNWNNNGPLHNVWFSFVATTTQINITVDIGGVKGTQSRTQLALWEADGTTELISDTYFPVFTEVDVDVGYIGLTVGSTYYISIDGFNTSSPGTFTLCLNDAVDYDFYEGAIDVNNLINNCSNDAEFSTDGATPDRNAGLHWNNNGPIQNRWFKFTAPSSDQFNITVDIGNVSNGPKGDQSRTQIAIWEADGTTEVSSTRFGGQFTNVTLGVPALTPNDTYYISIDVTSQFSAGSFTLCLDTSDSQGNIIINEVLFSETASGAIDNDEFIELYNAGTTVVDLAGWQLIDGNLLVINQTDFSSSISGSESPFTFSCSGSEVCTGTTVLEPGDYAVIWVGAQNVSKNAPNAVFQAWLNQSTRLNNTGDDIWLYDANTTLVDYMAYGANGSINQPPQSILWDTNVQTTLGNASGGQSISLSTNGIDGNTSDCWEPSTSGQASGRCTGYLPTVDSDGSTRIASPGENNNGSDTDQDGILDSIDLDDDNDGILDTIETTANLDEDGDGLINSLDLDSDGDGIPDNIEAQSSIGYIAPNADTPLDYATNNGINSAYLGSLIPENTDGTDNPDYLDTDSDNEGGNDTEEAGITLANADLDNDGLDDNTDTTNDYSDSGGTIDNPLLTLPDIDGDANSGGDVDYRDAIDNRPDNDLDGIVDVIDLDDDNDGILDTNEGCDSTTDVANTIGFGNNVVNATYTIPEVDITYTVNNPSGIQIRGFDAGANGPSIRFSGNNVPATGSVTSTFSNPVTNVGFKLTDLDENEDFTVNVYDENNVLYDLNVFGVVAVGSFITQNGNNFVSTPNNPNINGDDPADDVFGSIIFFFPEQVSRIEIVFNYPNPSSASVRYTQPTYCSLVDTDGDTVIDQFDLDSDADGCNDAVEAGFTDPDDDGILGNSPVTVDANGLVIGQGGYTIPLDTDANTVFDFQEINAPTWVTAIGSLDVTVECAADVPVNVLPPLVNHCGDVTVAEVSDITTPGSCVNSYIRVLTYQATSSTGITSPLFTTTITVEDTTAPTASNLDTITVFCAANIPAPDVSIVDDEADNCSVNPIVTFVSDVSDGGTNPEVIIRTYSIADECGNAINVTQLITLTPMSIIRQPIDVSIFAGENASFTVAATNADTYQWQVSVDGGLSYTNISDSIDYSGTQTATLTANTVGTDKNTYLFRVLASNSGSSCDAVTSTPALLTVDIRTVITNRRITYRVKKN